MNIYNIIQICEGNELKLNNCYDYQFNLSLKSLYDLSKSSDLFISVDNFYPHFCNMYNMYGIVIFGKSDPDIFGYPKNINILKDRKYLRSNQFDIWEHDEFDANAFDKINIKNYLID